MRKRVLIVRTTMGQGGADRVSAILLNNFPRERFEMGLLIMRNEGEHLSGLSSDVKVICANAANLWVFLPGILNAIREFQPDVVLSTDGGANVPLSILAAINPFRKWRAVVSERNVVFPPGKNVLKRAILVLAKSVFYRFADRITAVSEGVRTDMTKWLWLRPGAITIVYNPVVDGQLLQSKEEKVGHPWFDPQRDIPVIVHAGRFVFQKDHVTLIDAFANLHVSTKARLFLLGDGPLKPMIQERVQHLGLSEYVEFAGFDLNPYKYFSRCDVFVLSSRHEGMPGVLIQAMACGAPAVSTDCPYGPSEIISKPGTDGLLVTVGNPKELARAIESLLQNNDMRLRIAHAGVQAVRKFHLAEALETYLKAVQW